MTSLSSSTLCVAQCNASLAWPRNRVLKIKKRKERKEGPLGRKGEMMLHYPWWTWGKWLHFITLNLTDSFVNSENPLCYCLLAVDFPTRTTSSSLCTSDVKYNMFCLFLLQASDDSSDSPEPGPVTCMEPFMVRRLSCRTVQLPPLAFRQAEQSYCDRKPESDTVTVPPRPTTLPLRTPPLIAITSADTCR